MASHSNPNLAPTQHPLYALTSVKHLIPFQIGPRESHYIQW